MLSLLSRVAEDRPLAVLVDDAHLLDPPSAQALCFAARRLTADPVVVLLAVRATRPVGRPLGRAARCSSVGGLAPPTRSRWPPGSATGSAADGAVAAARGDRRQPAGAARAHRRRALDALPPGAPVPVPGLAGPRRSPAAPTRSPPDARTALLVAAAAGGDLAPIARRLRAARRDASATSTRPSARRAARRRRRPGSRSATTWSAPAVYAEAPPAARRAVHAALAAGRARRRRRPPRLAPRRGDRGPGRVRRAPCSTTRPPAPGTRGAHAVAAAGYERAARLSPDPADARRSGSSSAAESAWRAGLPDAATRPARPGRRRCPQPPALRDPRRRRSTAPSPRAPASVERARDVLPRRRDRAPPTTTPTPRSLLLADAILACQFAGDIATAAPRRRARSTGSAARPQPARLGGRRWPTAVAGVLTGHGGPDASCASASGARSDAVAARDPQLAPWLVVGAALPARERAPAGTSIPTVVDDTRGAAATSAGCPFLLFYVARDQATTDRWDDAVAGYTEGIAARPRGRADDRPRRLPGRAGLAARPGGATTTRAGRTPRRPWRSPRAHHLGVLPGLGDDGARRARARPRAHRTRALERLRASSTPLLTDLGLVDVDLSPAAGAGRGAGAPGAGRRGGAAGARYADRARRGQGPAVVAGPRRPRRRPDLPRRRRRRRASRSRSPTTSTPRTTSRPPAPQLAYGSRLRRARAARRRPAARCAPRSPRSSASAPSPWADQAAAELRATGETAQRRSATGLDHLTPQELQIARMLAGGRTTREAARGAVPQPEDDRVPPAATCT